jgi:hypothetical protein
VPPVIIIRTLDSGKLKSGIKCAIAIANNVKVEAKQNAVVERKTLWEWLFPRSGV